MQYFYLAIVGVITNNKFYETEKDDFGFLTLYMDDY